MGAALLIARSRLRANVTATVLLVLLAGIGGGIVMASLAGIRRADDSWQRFQAENPKGDVGIVFLGPEGEPLPSIEDDQADEVAELETFDEIAVVSRATAAVGVLQAPDGRREPVAANVYLDAPHPALVGRPVIVDGRLPAADAAGEVAINELLADRYDLDVGDEIDLAPFRFDELDDASDGRDVDPSAAFAPLEVAGIVRRPIDLLPPRTEQSALYSDEGYLLLTAAWWSANEPDVANYGVFILADLREGAANDDLVTSLDDRFGERAFAIPGIEEVGIPADLRRAVDRQIGAEGRAVTAFAAAVALVALALFGLALSRQLTVESVDQADLRALGLTRRLVLVVNLARSVAIAAGAGGVAVVVAIGLSGFLPVGVGRRTLRDDGPNVDEPVLLLGAITLVVLVAAMVVLLGWRASRPRARRAQPRRLADRVARAGAPAPVTVGVEFALGRAGAERAGHAVVVVVALAVAVVVGAAGIVGSLDDLRRDGPRLGQVWDASAGNFASEVGRDQGLELLAARDDVDVVAGERTAVALIEGRPTGMIAYEPYQGELPVALRDGRRPANADEVVLGAQLADQLDAEIGDRVAAAVGEEREPHRLEVVGIGPVAAMGVEIDPGKGILVHPDLVSATLDSDVSVLLVRFTPGTDKAAAVAELVEQFPRTVLVAPVPSRSVQTLTGLTILPIALAVTVTLLALSATASAAIASVRRRRRDLAVLKVLGMHRADVRRVVRWQGLTWSALGLVVGIPIGLVLGATGWREVVRSLGLEAPLAMPVLVSIGVLLAVPIALVALTAWPARRAADTPAAVTLRSE